MFQGGYGNASNLSQKRLVTPAKAGVQCLKQTFKHSFKDFQETYGKSPLAPMPVT